jgi:hypothetical protein
MVFQTLGFSLNGEQAWIQIIPIGLTVQHYCPTSQNCSVLLNLNLLLPDKSTELTGSSKISRPEDIFLLRKI